MLYYVIYLEFSREFLETKIKEKMKFRFSQSFNTVYLILHVFTDIK